MLVLGGGSAMAATGGSFILGRSNGASTTTTLTNSTGTALSLKAPATKAPLAVSNGVRVPNLNADKVDGVSVEGLARTAGRTGTREVFSTSLSLDPASNGRTDTLLAEARCPAGTILTGGGYEDMTQTGIVFVNAPNPEATMWQAVVAVDPTVNEDVQSVVAWATCYNPVGAVPAQTTALSTPQSQASAAVTPQLRQQALAQQKRS